VQFDSGFGVFATELNNHLVVYGLDMQAIWICTAWPCMRDFVRPLCAKTRARMHRERLCVHVLHQRSASNTTVKGRQSNKPNQQQMGPPTRAPLHRQAAEVSACMCACTLAGDTCMHAPARHTCTPHMHACCSKQLWMAHWRAVSAHVSFHCR
jgi:hypothetical protein